MFMAEKAPYIVTLFAAAFSWLTIRTADRLSSIPFVEYSVASAENDGHPGVVVHLRNITLGSKFSCLQLTLGIRQGGTLKFGDPKDQQVILRGTVLSTLKLVTPLPEEWDIQINNLSPGADVSLFVPTTGKGSPAALIGSCSASDSGYEKTAGGETDDEKATRRSGGELPVLVERSLTTVFVEHELCFLWSALLVWLVIMVVPIWISHRKGRRPTNGNSAEAADVDNTG